MAGNANGILCLPAGGMDLAATLYCGQSFVWQPEAVEGAEWQANPSGPAQAHIGVAGSRAARVWQEGGQLFVQRLAPAGEEGRTAGGVRHADNAGADDEAFWRRYFALDIDYEALEAQFSQAAGLAPCVAHARGIRVLRQPFFDTLLSFIISQNNHLARITGIVSRLRESFGPPLVPGVYGMPGPEALASLRAEDLGPLRAGFRAKYLVDAAQKVAAGEVEESALRAAGDEEARAMLCRIYGVGTKVADCVLLYALGRSRVVPMDVWMKRAMAAVFPDGMPPCTEGFEGIAQQYIFIWARDNL